MRKINDHVGKFVDIEFVFKKTTAKNRSDFNKKKGRFMDTLWNTVHDYCEKCVTSGILYELRDVPGVEKIEWEPVCDENKEGDSYNGLKNITIGFVPFVWIKGCKRCIPIHHFVDKPQEYAITTDYQIYYGTGPELERQTTIRMNGIDYITLREKIEWK
jgi:hypothetical protein